MSGDTAERLIGPPPIRLLDSVLMKLYFQNRVRDDVSFRGHSDVVLRVMPVFRRNSES